MTILSKTTGGLSLTSCLYDMHKCGIASANNAYAKASSNTFIANELNSLRSDKFSYKDAKIKEWNLHNTMLQPINETLGRITGYVKGFISSGANYIPNISLSIAALLLSSKGKSTKIADKVANAASIGLCVLEGGNFIKNTSGIGQRNDYLKM